MEHTHTRGPWMVCIAKTNEGTLYKVLQHVETAISADRAWWADDLNEDEIQIDDYGYHQPDENSDLHDVHIANARLISAAPEMLEVLQKLCAIQEYVDVSSWAAVWFDARAAINKATGVK